MWRHGHRYHTRHLLTACADSPNVTPKSISNFCLFGVLYKSLVYNLPCFLCISPQTRRNTGNKWKQQQTFHTQPGDNTSKLVSSQVNSTPHKQIKLQNAHHILCPSSVQRVWNYVVSGNCRQMRKNWLANWNSKLYCLFKNKRTLSYPEPHHITFVTVAKERRVIWESA